MTRTRAHCPRTCLRVWTPLTATGRLAGPPAPLGQIPATLPPSGPPSLTACAMAATHPPDPAASPWDASDFLGGAPQPSGLRGGIQVRASASLAPSSAGGAAGRLSRWPGCHRVRRQGWLADPESPVAACTQGPRVETRSVRFGCNVNAPSLRLSFLPRTLARSLSHEGSLHAPPGRQGRVLGLT